MARARINRPSPRTHTVPLVVLTATLAAASADIESAPFSTGSHPHGAPDSFRLIQAQDSGLEFVNPVDTSHPRKYLYVGGYAAGGIAIADINGDSLPDVFCAGGPVSSALFEQLPKSAGQSHPRFRKTTKQSGISLSSDEWSAGAAFVDIDNDGDQDLYVTNYDSPNRLYINQLVESGAATFVDRAPQFGLAITDASFTPSFADFDRDGDLDLYLIGYQYKNPAGRPAQPPIKKAGDGYEVEEAYQKYYGIITGEDGRPTFRNVGRSDYLFRNDGGKFTDVTKSAGIADVGVGNSALWWDFNEDGWPDLFVANDFKAPDALYLNNRDGTFRDVSKITFAHTTWFSMGSDIGDVNNDGRLDLLVSDMAGSTHYRAKVTMGEMGTQTTFLATAEPRQFMRNALFLNTGTTRFLEAAYMAGIANSDWTWATKLLDLDGDGWLDVFFTNGAARMFNHSDLVAQQAGDLTGTTEWDRWENSPTRKEENLAFRNSGTGLAFEAKGKTWGLDHSGMSYAAAHADLDSDGDLDLVVANLDEPVSVYLNDLHGSNHVHFALEGTKSNRQGIGATVEITTRAGTQTGVLNPYTGFQSSNQPTVHFGLGEEQTIEHAKITWPSGIVQSLSDLPAGHVHTITETSQSSSSPPSPQRPTPAFVPSRTFPAVQFTERPFDDYARQPLLPYQHSRLGGAVAVADVDSDGDLDYYFARPAGSPRAVYIAGKDGSFAGSSAKVFDAHRGREDMGCLFFDADSDGDSDLFVVSGSVECEPGSELLADRLYLNDGKGTFKPAPASALPPRRDSGSVVAAADVDRDGDLDLFVGGRVVPGRYPEFPQSALLENVSTAGTPKFVDSTPAPIRTTGLVTAALWSDVDGDSWPDLLVAHEWGPVKLYHNNKGTLNEAASTGVSGLSGWWNGLGAGDIDNDGDIDYVATNFGLNTAYHATPDHPALLYYGDFDGTGKPHLVEAKDKDGKLLPWRGLSCSSGAMPFIRKKLPTFDAFGRASLGDIYTDPALENAIVRRATTFESTLFINVSEPGKPQFQPVPLPRLAQISPSFGVNLVDVDGDTRTDCFLAQNFYAPQLEVGRMDSGLSLLLRGTEDGLQPEWPRSSGISIRGDAMGSVISDYNRDGSPDLLVAVNNGVLQAFDNTASKKHLAVELAGLAGNLHATGARLSLTFAEPSAPTLAAEIHTGSGYLSQSSPTVYFGRSEFTPSSVKIRWPDGSTSTHPVPGNAYKIRLPHPRR